MSKYHVKRYSEPLDSIGMDISMPENAPPDEPPRMHLRNQATPYIKDKHCVICCTGSDMGDMNCAITFNTHEKLQNIAMNDFELMTRLESARDAIAGDVMYHSLCLRKQTRVTASSGNKPEQGSHENIFSQLKEEMIWRTCRGQAVLVSDCWVRFQELCEDNSLVVPYYFEKRRAFFRYKLTELLPNITVIPHQGTDLEDHLLISSSLSLPDVCELLKSESDDDAELKLPAYNENEMVQVVHVALYLRSQIIQHTPNVKAELTEENAYASLPEALYVFMAIMYGGSAILAVDEEGDEESVEEHGNASKLRKEILDVCQYLT